MLGIVEVMQKGGLHPGYDALLDARVRVGRAGNEITPTQDKFWQREILRGYLPHITYSFV